MPFILQIPLPPPDDGGPEWDSTFGTVVLILIVSPIAAFVGYLILEQYGITQRPLLYGSIFVVGILVALLVRLFII